MVQRIIIMAFVVLVSSCGSENVENQNPTSVKTETEKPKTTPFPVDNVEVADSLLDISIAKEAFEYKIGKEIMFFPEEHANFDVVPCVNNGLIQTVHECYANHRPLILTPDAIWLTICQGVSIHINEQYDSLKNIIFVENKPDKIVIRNDSLEYSGKHWESLLASFSNETKKYTTEDFYSFFVPEFSTSTKINRVAYQITMLQGFKKAFQYISETGCGIPTIEIKGSVEDWQLIYNKLDMLDQLGLVNWGKNLKPIIQEFIKAAEGKQDEQFWKGIYKDAWEYGVLYTSGWIIKFFPYIKEQQNEGYDEATDMTKKGEVFIPNEFLDDDKYLLSTLCTDNFPSGVAKINITWNNHFKGTTENMEVYAGFFAIKQYPDKSLEPLISWAICDKNAKKLNFKEDEQGISDPGLEHKPDYWSPYLARIVTDSAVYDIKRFKTHKKSISYVKQVILDSLQNNPAFDRASYLNDSIQLVVLSNGKVGEVSMKNSQNKKLTKFISGVIKGLPEEWFPALAHPGYLGLDVSKEENKLKVRAHSVVKIGI